MTQEWFWEVPTGAIDGINTTYTLIRAYGELTLGVWANGVLGERGSIVDYGWVETDRDAGVFDMRKTLFPGDRLRVFYADSGLIVPVAGVVLNATVRAPRIQASLDIPLILGATVAAPRVSALLSSTQSVKALLRVVRVSATVKVCL